VSKPYLKNVDYYTIVLTNSSTREREREETKSPVTDRFFSFGDKTSDKTRSSLKSSEPLAWLRSCPLLFVLLLARCYLRCDLHHENNARIKF
jgi:serine/threonine protein kinase HipA of HipAB toxin-antitoxin module